MVNHCGNLIQDENAGVTYKMINVNHQNSSDAAIISELLKVLQEKCLKGYTDEKIVAICEKILSS